MAGVLKFAQGEPRPVMQEELLNDRILHHKALVAMRRWRRHRRDLVERLVAGAGVEQGPLAVGLDIRIR